MLTRLKMMLSFLSGGFGGEGGHHGGHDGIYIDNKYLLFGIIRIIAVTFGCLFILTLFDTESKSI